jgi:hypothetical protein
LAAQFHTDSAHELRDYSGHIEAVDHPHARTLTMNWKMMCRTGMCAAATLASFSSAHAVDPPYAFNVPNQRSIAR